MPVREKKGFFKYERAFREIGVFYDSKAKAILNELESEGRTEGSICYALWKERELLRLHRDKPDFWIVFKESVQKWSWAKDDPRWEDWRKKKDAQDKARKRQEEIIEEMRDRTFYKPYAKDLTGFIYFIQGECGGPIKIGYTTDLENRIKKLQTGYPDRLQLLLAFPGNKQFEQAIHKQFEQYRLNGEWFRPAPEVLQRIGYFALLNAHVAAKAKDLMQVTL